jgi:NADH-quinone oxidoreductase subunit N
MTAPMLWIFMPLILAACLFFISNQKLNVLIASIFVFFLTLTAWLIPIDTSLTIGNFSFKITSSFEILGRHLILDSADRAMLALVYGTALFWFVTSLATQVSRFFIPVGLAITALLVAALSVEPFLYAALLIELAVLLAVPLLSNPGQRPGKGLIRFLIFQTLAMPFFLFSGWLLAGIDANPGNLGMVQQVVILITLGFALLLAVFPFHTWIPMLAEEASPFVVGFIFWIFPTAGLFFGLRFLDHYAWLREAPSLGNTLAAIGILMIVTAGILAAFQQHAGRILGFAVIMETGYSLLAMSLGGQKGLDIFYMLLVPRILILVLWSLALVSIQEHRRGLSMEQIKGTVRTRPFASAGLVLANLALVGVPLLAGFPAHQAIWDGLAVSSLSAVIWIFIGSLGLVISALRTIFSLVVVQGETPWVSSENAFQRVMISLGILALFLVGLFPHWALLLWTKLPAMFTHLGQ